MQKNKNVKEHPEVSDMKNICDIAPNTESTKDICDKVPHKKKSKVNKRNTK
jgi:hypothetical protein